MEMHNLKNDKRKKDVIIFALSVSDGYTTQAEFFSFLFHFTLARRTDREIIREDISSLLKSRVF
jgi:hypothetical protein